MDACTEKPNQSAANTKALSTSPMNNELHVLQQPPQRQHNLDVLL